jgi:hypothetical protein
VAYYIRQLADEYIGLQRRLTANAWPIITDEYNDFIFLLVLVLAASLTRSLKNRQNIQEIGICITISHTFIKSTT